MIDIDSTVGNYVIKGKVGEGGMGAVYVAEHKRFGRKVAVKTLHPHLSRNQEMVARFFREAKSANEIRNQHIIEILDFDELPDGTCYIVMEWLSGHSLQQLLNAEGKLELERALHIADGICSALGAAHARKIIHRDLKPDNVFLEDRNGDADFVKVLDFGIAKLLEEEDDKKGFATKTGAIIGTPAYMSPEQCRGAHKEIDHRTDIYAAGVMVYQMVSGRRPFQGEGLAELLMAHLTVDPEPPSLFTPGLPAHVDRAILRALAKQRDMRFQAIEDFSAALRGVEVPIGGTIIGTRAPSRVYRAAGSSPSSPGLSSQPGARPEHEATVMGEAVDPGSLPPVGGTPSQPPVSQAPASASVPPGALAANPGSTGSAGPSIALPEKHDSTLSSVPSEVMSLDSRQRKRGSSALVFGGALAAVLGVGAGFVMFGNKASTPTDPVTAPSAPATPPSALAPATPPPAAPAPAAPTAAAAPSAPAPAAAPSTAPPVAKALPAGPAEPAPAPVHPAGHARTEPAAPPAAPDHALPKLKTPAEFGAAPTAPPAPAAPAPAPAPAPAADRKPAIEAAFDNRENHLERCLAKAPTFKKATLSGQITVSSAGAVLTLELGAESPDGDLPEEVTNCFQKVIYETQLPKGSQNDTVHVKWKLVAPGN